MPGKKPARGAAQIHREVPAIDPPGYGAQHVEKVIRLRRGSPEPAKYAAKGRRLAWASERVIVARKPGNAGGAKGPYLGWVSEEEKEEVIDDESDNTE